MAGRGLETIKAYGTVMRDPTLTCGEKVLWGIYRAWDMRGDGAWPGDEVVAQEMGVCDRQLRRCRADLIQRGYLIQRRRARKTAIYHAVVPERSPENEAAQDTPWDSQDEAVRRLEMLCRLHAEERFDEMDSFEELEPYFNLLDQAIYDRLTSDVPWRRTEARAQLHRALPAMVREVARANGAGGKNC